MDAPTVGGSGRATKPNYDAGHRELGARHIDIGQRPAERHVVLAGPDGDEFRVLSPGQD